MSQKQLIQISAINVVLQQHPAGAYASLLRAAFRRKHVGKVFADRYGMFSQLYPVRSDNAVVGYQGVISTFTRLDPSLPWFNVETTEAASDDELEEIAVPEHLRPNHRQCNFYFDVTKHVFIFDSLSRKGGITAAQMIHFLQQQFQGDPNEVPRLFVIPDSASVDEILQWDSIRALVIHAIRPNPDFDEDDFEEFKDWMGSQNAIEFEEKLTAEPNQSLEPNDETKVIAAIASENGFVEARGLDPQGNVVVKSTKAQKPLVEKFEYDSDGETYWDAFKRVAAGVVNQVAARRRQSRRR